MIFSLPEFKLLIKFLFFHSIAIIYKDRLQPKGGEGDLHMYNNISQVTT